MAIIKLTLRNVDPIDRVALFTYVVCSVKEKNCILYLCRISSTCFDVFMVRNINITYSWIYI